jgi:predicted acyltransferase
MPAATLQPNPPIRLLSLDFLRGFIMVMLALESTELFGHIDELTANSAINPLIQQLFHHPWHGLRFWDLIQPGFMFIAGAAMAFSLDKQFKHGVPWKEAFIKVLKRSGWLFFWGVLNYAVAKDGSLSFKLWNVLTQLSFTTLVAFLVFQWSNRNQVIFCVFILLLTEVLYRFTGIQGFDKPFTDQHNFGNYVDLLLMNQVSPGGWVAINCIPTSVHTIAGAVAGRILLNKQPVKWINIAGVTSLVIGYGLDLAGITPIIKRISTSSFTLASLGWCLLGLAFVYWWIDIRKHHKHLKFLPS